MVGHATEPHEAGHGDRRIALLISALAFCLALTSTAGNNAQTEAISRNIEASDLWAFFQARTIRQTVVNTAGEIVGLLAEPTDNERSAPIAAQVQRWRDTAARWESEPQTGDGRRELAARARQAEEKRERAIAAHHLYDFATAAFELGTVLASASIITKVVALAFAAGGLWLVGVALGLIGWLAPTALHL